MIRACSATLGRSFRFIRRRPISASLLVLVVFVALGIAGTYGYAVHQWRRAQTDVRESRPAEALQRLEYCLRIWPDDANVRHLAARAARQTGDFVTAESHLNACLRIENGASEETQLEFLLMRAQTGEVEEVSGLLLNFVARGHQDSDLILETIALVYMHHLRYGPAYSVLKQWIDHNPNSVSAHRFRGWVLERMNQPGPALSDYLRALELDPKLDPIRIRVVEMYLDDKETFNALPHLDYLQAKAAERPEVIARVGQCRFLQGKHIEARQLLEIAVNSLPNDSGVLIHLARLDVQDKQFVRAEQRLRRVIELDPSDTEARYWLASALQQQGRDSDAQKELAEYEHHKLILEKANHLLQQEAKQPSRDPQAASEIGALLLEIRQDRQGLYWMDEALQRNPDHKPTHQALATYYEKKGDSERAAFHRRRLLK